MDQKEGNNKASSESFPIDKAISVLRKEVPSFKVPIVDLIKVQTNDPFKVLVTTILSARTNDSTTAKAATKLFEIVKNKDDLEKLSEAQIEKLIYPVGFYKNKSKFLKKLPMHLKDGVPDTIDELIKLPGVGRKTANLVVSVGFNKPAICVDVHVHRISNRWGYLKTKTPFETEMELRRILPRKYWIEYNSSLVAYGQNICRPINPKCNICSMQRFCKYNLDNHPSP
jgi:endonuclease III